MNSLSAANRNYCAAAPASIAGFYMSAKRFIAHGMLYGEEGHARQYFYYDEVTDEEISELLLSGKVLRTGGWLKAIPNPTKAGLPVARGKRP